MDGKIYKLSDDFAGSLLVALQNALLHETDISEELDRWDIVITSEGSLRILNPPRIEDLEVERGFDEEEEGWFKEED